jgi:predicted extracellular nuclease
MFSFLAVDDFEPQIITQFSVTPQPLVDSVNYAVEAFDKATVQPSGPRRGNNGKIFFNIEGNANEDFASFGVADFMIESADLGFTTVTDIIDLDIKLTQSNLRFTNSGPISIWLTEQTDVSIQPNSSIAYQTGNNGEASVDPLLKPLFELGQFTFTKVGTGTTDTFDLFAGLDPNEEQIVLNAINSGTPLRLLMAPENNTVSATYAGVTNSSNAGPTLVVEATGEMGGETSSGYSEDFNAFAGNGFAPEPLTGQLNSNAWIIAGLSDGSLNFGDTKTNGDFARGVSNGGVSTGGIYSFTVASGNNILGVQPTGDDFTPGEIILRLQNRGEMDLIQVEIDYDIWYRNDQPRANSLNFSYSTDGITYLSVDDLGFISPQGADASPSWQTVARSTTITGLTLNPDDFFYLKWTGNDVSGSGSRDEYGIDNVMVSGLSLPDVTPPDPTIVPIHMIQGDGFQSPILGETVIVKAVVVGEFQGSTGLSGFFLQEEDMDADGNAATSEGIFIFDGSSPMVDVNIGDLVQVTGTVAEFNNLTELTNVTMVQILSSSNPLPTAATVNFPVAGDADLEAVEGMLVTVPDKLFVTEYFNLDRFGEVRLSSDGTSNAAGTDGRLDQYTQFNAPSVEGFAQYQEDLAKRQIVLDDGSTVQNPFTLIFGRDGNPISKTNTLRGGDPVTGLMGVMDERFGDYRLQTNKGVDFQAVNERPDTPENVGGSLKVASFNVLNFFTTLDVSGNPGSGPNNLEPRGANSQREFDRQLEKLVTTLTTLDADIIGLTELENEFGGDQNGDGKFAIETLVEALNAEVGAGTYAFVDPGVDYVGSDAISVGVLYQPATVQIAPRTTVELLTDADLSELDVDLSGEPVFEGEATSRVPLAVTFLETRSGGKFTLAINHFKSKGQSGLTDTSNPNFDQGDGQGFWNFRRTEAAKAIDAWLKTDPTGSGDGDYLIIGDLNSYAQEDPITYLKGQGYTNLIETYVGDDAYSYLFDGQFGTLDYGLANTTLNAQVTGATEWHINADEPDALDYNLDFGRDPNLFDGSVPFRTSDHDPIVIGLDLVSPPPKLVSGTPDDDYFDSVFPDNKQFVGDNQILSTGSGDDYVDVTYAVGGNTIRTASGDDIIYAGTNNRIKAGADNDILFLGSGGGNNRVTGGSGADQFWITEDDDLLVTNPNMIGDYKASEGDVIGFLATSLSFDQRGEEYWNYRQSGANTIIEAFGQDVAILKGINAITLTEANFVFS